MVMVVILSGSAAACLLVFHSEAGPGLLVILFVPSIKRMFLMPIILKADQLPMAGEADVVAQGGAEGFQCLAGLLADRLALRVAHQAREPLRKGVNAGFCHGVLLLIECDEKQDAPGLTFNQTQ